MKLVIKTDYNTYFLFPAGTDAGRVIADLAQATRLQCDGYGKDRVFKPHADGHEMSVEFIPDDSVHFPSPDSQPYIDRLIAVEKELNDTRAKLYQAELSVTKLTKAADARKVATAALLGDKETEVVL